MAFSAIPSPASDAASVAMRHIASDVGETIARSREVIQQAREAMVRANLILEGSPTTTKRTSP